MPSESSPEFIRSSKCPTLPENLAFFDGFAKNANGIFGVQYGDPMYVLNIPGPYDAPTPHLWRRRPEDFKSPVWLKPEHAYLAFLPRQYPFSDHIFAALNIPAYHVPLECVVSARADETYYLLERSVRTKWIRIETVLLEVLCVLAKMCVRYVPNLRMFAPPWSQQYRLPAATRELAISAILRARDSFLPLFAQLAMYFAILDLHGPKDWRMALQAQTRLPWQIVDDLDHSVIGDMNRDRMGGIIDLSPTTNSRTCDNDVDMILPSHPKWLFASLIGRHRVPLYLFFGDRVSPKPIVVPSLLNLRFVPNEQEYAHLLSLPGNVVFSPWRDDGAGGWESLRHLAKPGSSSNAPQRAQHPSTQFIHRPMRNNSYNIGGAIFPPPEKGSGQLAGESFWDFIARRKIANTAAMAKETPEQAQKRLQREEIAQLQEVPSKHKMRCFKWEPFNGFLIRRLLVSSIADEDFLPAQRVYNSVADEWDLCEAASQTGCEERAPVWR
ncbi:hypothetical protein MKEN_00604200 [Mycena kentingensis (nom. inval.)]|nr:hypothetical protein MKEN_00604200 [Mycena kentingensis (nom. inval.)]